MRRDMMSALVSGDIGVQCCLVIAGCKCAMYRLLRVNFVDMPWTYPSIFLLLWKRNIKLQLLFDHGMLTKSTQSTVH